MLLDHSDRWDELPNVVKIAAALSARTKGLEWLDATERTLWRRTVLVDVRSCFKRTSPRKCGRGTRPTESEVPRNAVWTGKRHPGRSSRRKCFLKRCVATAKAVGAGDDEEDGGLDDAVEDAGASSNSTAPPLSSTALYTKFEFGKLKNTPRNES